jgi:hypothetical protein
MNTTTTLNESAPCIYISPSFDPKTLATYSIYTLCSIIPAFLAIPPILLNILVFANPRLADPAFKILLTIAITDLLYMLLDLINLFMDIYCEPMPFMCGNGGINGQYISFFLDQLLGNYLTSCLALYSILAEIFLITQRLFHITDLRGLRGLTARHVSPVIAVISLIYYLSFWFCYAFKATGQIFVYKNHTYVEYNLELTRFGETSAGTWLLSALNIVRMALVIVVLFFLNMLSVVYFQKFLKKKSNLTGKSGKS